MYPMMFYYVFQIIKQYRDIADTAFYEKKSHHFFLVVIWAIFKHSAAIGWEPQLDLTSSFLIGSFSM